MALNLADMTTLIAFVGCPIAAGAQAASLHVGWYIILFVGGGFAVGFALAYIVNRISYLILMKGTKAQETRPWLIGPVLISYMLLPLALAVLGISGTGNAAALVANHFWRSSNPPFAKVSDGPNEFVRVH